MQNEVDELKYQALAYSTSSGLELADKVEENWLKWVEKVEHAPWLRNWSRSDLYQRPGCSPRGARCENSAAAIASVIYATFVWGMGIDKWLHFPKNVPMHDPDTRIDTNEPMKRMLHYQNVRCPSAARTYMWDEVLYRGCGMQMPIEFGELDRWLQPMWDEILEAHRAKALEEYKQSILNKV